MPTAALTQLHIRSQTNAGHIFVTAFEFCLLLNKARKSQTRQNVSFLAITLNL